MKKLSCIIYTHYTFGIGHLQRAKVLAEELKKDYDVTLISSGAELKNFEINKAIEWVKLPGEIKEDLHSKGTVFENNKFDRVKYIQKRISSVKLVIDKKNPSLFITEFYPFGNFRLNDTLPVVLNYIKEKCPYCKIVSSVRDLPISDSENITNFNFKVVGNDLNKYYDLLLVHSPEEFSILSSKSFLKKLNCKIPIIHTGFVVDVSKSKSKKEKNSVLVAVGGGRDGHILLDKIYYSLCNGEFDKKYNFTFVTGEFHKTTVEYVHPQIKKVYRFIKNLSSVYSNYDFVISMAGYNTTAELLASDTKAILVPRLKSYEQLNRAKFAQKNSQNILCYKKGLKISDLVDKLSFSIPLVNDSSWFSGAIKTREIIKNLLNSKEKKINLVVEGILETKKMSIEKIPNFPKGVNKIFIVGWGKAVDFVVLSLLLKIPSEKIGGVLFLSSKPDLIGKNYSRLHCTHPFISRKNVVNTKKIIDLIKSALPDDLIVCVSTGGGSAMLEYSHNFNQTDLEKINRHLVLSSMDCRKINAVRKTISSVKCGKLLNYTPAINVINLIVSDDVKSRGSKIASKYVASGPGVPQSCPKLSSLKSLGLDQKLLDKISSLNKTSLLQKNVKSVILSDNLDLCKSISKKIDLPGHKVFIRKSPYFDDTSIVSKKLVSEFIRLKKKYSSFVYVCGGEPTVNLGKKHGVGGRAQQLAAEIMNNMGDERFSLISIASDGVDFLKDVSGVFVSSRDIYFCKLKKVNITKFIKNKNTYFLHKIINSIIPYIETGTNLGDVVILFSEE